MYFFLTVFSIFFKNVVLVFQERKFKRPLEKQSKKLPLKCYLERLYFFSSNKIRISASLSYEEGTANHLCSSTRRRQKDLPLSGENSQPKYGLRKGVERRRLLITYLLFVWVIASCETKPVPQFRDLSINHRPTLNY